MTRHLIVRLNVRLKSMNSVPVKCLREDSTQPSLYIALAAVRHKRIVSKIAGAKEAAHNLADIDYSSECATLGANEVRDVGPAL